MSFITFTAVIVFFVSSFDLRLLSINLTVISYKFFISDFTSFVKNLIKIDKTFSNATNRVQNAYGKKYSTEGIEMYQSPYDVNYAEKFLSQQQTTPTTPTKPTLQQMISGTVPKQLTQRKVNEDEISDEEVKRVLGIK